VSLPEDRSIQDVLFEGGELVGGIFEVCLLIVAENSHCSDILDGLCADSPYQQCNAQRAKDDEYVVVEILVEYSCFGLEGGGGGCFRSGSSCTTLRWGSLGRHHLSDGQDGHKSS